MWVARDKSGILCLYNSRPIRDKKNGCWEADSPLFDSGIKTGWLQILPEDDTCKDLAWESEPRQVWLTSDKDRPDIGLAV